MLERLSRHDAPTLSILSDGGRLCAESRDRVEGLRLPLEKRKLRYTQLPGGGVPTGVGQGVFPEVSEIV